MAVIRSRAVGRISVAVLVAIGVGLAVGHRFSWPIATLAGWNAGGLLMVILSWLRIATYDEVRTAERAAGDDPGRTAVYALVLLTSAASLLSATAIVRHARALSPTETGLLIALCLSTVALSWTVTHTAFTLRYAHLYYRDDAEGVGGIEFAGGRPPCYGDFAYLAFTIGMCFQVSDTTITSRQIRATVLRQAVLSFAYNTAILAFVLNLVFGRAGL
jgi:uncharacterized membrane protein